MLCLEACRLATEMAVSGVERAFMHLDQHDAVVARVCELSQACLGPQQPGPGVLQADFCCCGGCSSAQMYAEEETLQAGTKGFVLFHAMVSARAPALPSHLT